MASCPGRVLVHHKAQPQLLLHVQLGGRTTGAAHPALVLFNERRTEYIKG